MASQLKVNTLTGVTTAGSIVVTGEGNSTTTNLQQGLAKAWLQGTNAAVLSDSLNISGGTDNGTGDYTYALSNNMTNNQWSQTSNALAAEIAQVKNTTLITSAISVAVFGRADSFAAQDQRNFVTLHGDLA
tara:strand:+ start:309 stop:701 length:393 start_codon:yes stop_codon:yes gene_type:complete